MKIVCIIFLIIPMISLAQKRIIHPNWAPKTWKLRPDDITTIMGYRAELTGNLTHVQHPDAMAIKAGNPNAHIGFSQSYGPSVSPFSEFQQTDGGGSIPKSYLEYMFEEKGQYEGLFAAVWFAMDGWIYHKPFNGNFYKKPFFSTVEYIEFFRNFDNADIPVTIAIAITADVTSKRPFFNPVCIDLMQEVRKAIKGNN